MITIFCLALLFVLVNSNFLAQIEERDYVFELSSIARIIEMAPKTEIFESHYSIDFAIGTESGRIYFGNLNYKQLKYSYKITKNAIKKMKWNEKGLHIYSGDEVKVIDDFSKMGGAFFGYCSKENTFLTAVTAFDLAGEEKTYRIEVFKNATSIYNISINYETIAITFDFEGTYLTFISCQKIDSSLKSSFNKFHIPTLTFVNISSSIDYAFENSLVYVPFEEHLQYSLVSANSRKLTIWNDSDPKSVELPESYRYFHQLSSDGKNIIGIRFLFDDQYQISLSEIYFHSNSSISLGRNKHLSVSSRIISFDMKRDRILVLTAYNKVAILCISGFFYSFWTSAPEMTKVSMAIVCFWFCIECCQRLLARREQQNGGYVEQVDVVNPLGSENFNRQAIEMTELRMRNSAPN